MPFICQHLILVHRRNTRRTYSTLYGLRFRMFLTSNIWTDKSSITFYHLQNKISSLFVFKFILYVLIINLIPVTYSMSICCLAFLIWCLLTQDFSFSIFASADRKESNYLLRVWEPCNPLQELYNIHVEEEKNEQLCFLGSPKVHFISSIAVWLYTVNSGGKLTASHTVHRRDCSSTSPFENELFFISLRIAKSRIEFQCMTRGRQ